MERKLKDLLLNSLGVFFFMWGVIAIINSIINENPFQILYLCYPGLIITGLGIFYRSRYLILSQIYILFLPLALWNVDFFTIVFTGKPLTGITNYFFEGTWNLGKIISLQHLFTIPLSLIAVYHIKFKEEKAWRLSIIQVILFYILTRGITPQELNINCVFRSCATQFPSGSIIPYPTLWFGIFFLSIIIGRSIVTTIFRSKF